MSRKKHKRADHRADCAGEGFIGLPRRVKRSEAYRTLSLFERAVFMEILAAFNGYNNGTIVISQRQIANEIGNSNYRKIGRSIAALIERGLIDITTEGLWGKRRAREYRLTFVSTGVPPHYRPATNEYRDWRQKKDADDVSAKKGKSADDASVTD